jgi:putative transposase
VGPENLVLFWGKDLRRRPFCSARSAVTPGRWLLLGQNEEMNAFFALLVYLRALLLRRLALAAENLALRQQLAMYHYSAPKPKLRDGDRRFWILLARLWPGWRSALLVVSPATVVRWHRQGFRYYWRWKSRGHAGRPPIDAVVRQLIRRLSRDNPLWGAPRIQAELHLLGHDLAESTVAKYMVRRRDQPPSQTWKTFLRNHVGTLAAIDFCVVPTVTFRLLYCFVVLRHDRRRVVHFNATQHPTSQWVSQQLREAFPFDQAPRYLIRDRDSIYGLEAQDTIRNLGIEEVLIAPQSPWQNPFVERLIGTLRRECLDHVIVLSETHLKRIVSSFLEYYHQVRPHRSLHQNAPQPREVDPPERGKVVAESMVGGLHHHYRRCA